MQELKKIFGKRAVKDERIQKYEAIVKQSILPQPDLHFKLGRLYQNAQDKISALKHYELAAKAYLKNREFIGAERAAKPQ